jgi:ankyrin repeat protein
MTDLISAVMANDTLKVQQLLLNGIDPNGVEDSAMVTPLHFAAQYGSYESALILIEAGALIDARTSDGITPLEIAKLHSKFDIVALLERQKVKLI